MKKTIFILLLLSLNFLSANNTNKVEMLKPNNDNFISKQETRPTEVIYHENFENGLNGWTTYDGFLPFNMWHLDDFMTPEGSGLSWWMGDSLIGGYYNKQYLVLDTPEISVPDEGHLTFCLTYCCEGFSDTPPWDGWDGCNIRISTDNGESWQIIEGTPEYDFSSLYSFGWTHGEGTEIPGWGGDSNGWNDADFDLSDFSGQYVRIRFAFASDGYLCTISEPSWFGLIIDNISLGDYYNDGIDGGMTADFLTSTGGDLWHLSEVDDAPSPTHAMVCQNEEGTYNRNMRNYLESPLLSLPEDSDEIYADFSLKGVIEDNDVYPFVDYFGWEISPDNGLTWYYMSNPYGEPNEPNYVYTSPPEAWGEMCDAWSVDGRIDDYAGYDVKFRIYLYSDNDEPIGEGLMIDDYKIYCTYDNSTEEELIPNSEFFLSNSPNPFSSKTKISFNLTAKDAKIIIYNIKGQKVHQLRIKNYELGMNDIIWDGKDENGKPVNSGIYFYKLKSDGFESPVRKMVLMR